MCALVAFDDCGVLSGGIRGEGWLDFRRGVSVRKKSIKTKVNNKTPLDMDSAYKPLYLLLSGCLLLLFIKL